jgi:hypothetical protein
VIWSQAFAQKERGCNCDGTCDDQTGGIKNIFNCPSDCIQESLFITRIDGRSGASGNMFDIYTKSALLITSFDMMVTGSGTYNAKVFMKAETYKGSEKTAGDWTLIHTKQVQGQDQTISLC